MTEFYQTILIITVITTLLALVGGGVNERLAISEPLIAIVVGMLAGPSVLGVIRLSHLGAPDRVLEETARFAMAVAVFGSALRLPSRHVQAHKRTLAWVLGCGMLGMWALSSALALALLDLDFWTAVLVGAILTPIDPVLSTAVVTSEPAERNVPDGLRHLLSAESGANDGLAMPLVMLPIYIHSSMHGAGVGSWLATVVIWEVLGGGAAGYVLGYGVARLMRIAQAQELHERVSLITLGLSLSLVVLAGIHLLGGNGLFAAFTAGLALNAAVRREPIERLREFQTSAKRFFEFPVFVLLGAALPVDDFAGLPLAAFVFSLLVLLLRRPPLFMLIGRWIPDLHRPVERLFLGWFGPIGISAVFYAMLAVRHGAEHRVWTICSLVIVASSVLHGLTGTPASKRMSPRDA